MRSANLFLALGGLTSIPKLEDITPSSLAKLNKLLIAPTATRLELSELFKLISHNWKSIKVTSLRGLLPTLVKNL